MTEDEYAARIAAIDRDYERFCKARDLRALAPTWTADQACEYARLACSDDGYQVIGYAAGPVLLCRDCGTSATLDTGLTVAQDSELSGIDYACEHAVAVLRGSEWDSIPTCDTCGAVLDGVTLTSDGIETEARAYAALARTIRRAARSGHGKPSAALLALQAARRAVLGDHGYDLVKLARMARAARP